MSNRLYTHKGWGLLRLAPTLAAAALGFLFCVPAWAGLAVYFGEGDCHRSVEVPAVSTPTEALDALTVPPSGMLTAVPAGTHLLSLDVTATGATANFSAGIVAGGLDESRSQAVYEQVRLTLLVNGIEGSIRVLADGSDLCAWADCHPNGSNRCQLGW
ncbi:MAG: GerMN domain-containing protein [Armatimonadota bacterium]